MKTTVLMLIGCLISSLALSQGNFKVVQQQQAHYPGGEVALQDYFNRKLTYSQEAYSKRVYGYVMLSFDVSADSTLSEIAVLKGVGYGIDDEVVRLIKPLKFAPAVSNNVAYRSNVIISVNVKAIPSQQLEIEKP